MKNKLIQIVFLTFALAAALAFAACGTGKSTSTPETKEKNTTVSETKPTDAKNDQAKSNPPASGDSVGVAECDEYIKKYEACLMSKVPEAGRALMKQSFEQQRSGFKQAAATAEGKKSLVSVCKTAMDSAKQATAAYACEW